MTWSFLTDIPTSTNELYKPVNSRFVISSKYRRWKDAVARQLLMQRRPLNPLSGKLSIAIRIPSGTKRDADNCGKSAQDALVSAGILDDDRFVDSILIYRSDKQPDGTCRIQVKELS